MVAQERDEKLLTVADLLAMPDKGMRRELSRGVLVEMTPVNYSHGFLVAAFASFLRAFVLKATLGWVTTETGYILAKDPDTVRAPDVAFLSRARLAKPNKHGFIPIAPDLAVEVVSPDDTATEILEKLIEYFEAGTRLVWVVYPEKQWVNVYKNAESSDTVKIDGTLDGGDVLPGFKLALRDVYEGWEE